MRENQTGEARIGEHSNAPTVASLVTVLDALQEAVVRGDRSGAWELLSQLRKRLGLRRAG